MTTELPPPCMIIIEDDCPLVITGELQPTLILEKANGQKLLPKEGGLNESLKTVLLFLPDSIRADF